MVRRVARDDSAARTNGFFAARPRHVLCAAAIAVEQPDADNRLFLLDRFEAGEAQRLVATLEAWRSSPFSRICLLGSGARSRSRRIRPAEVLRGLARFAVPYRNRSLIRREFSDSPPDVVYTSVDHRAEMQYAMHLARRLRADSRCVYVEDGSAAYAKLLPRRRQAFPRTRRLIKTMVRRLHHGFWWRDVDAQGASPWLDEGLFSFPDLVQPYLRERPVGPLPASAFHGPQLQELAAVFAERYGLRRDPIARAEVLIGLASTISAKRIPAYAATMKRLCEALVDAGAQVLVKHHPREQDAGFFGIEERDGLHVLPKEIPFEVFLLLVRRPDLTVVGDISTAMMSARWILPESNIVAMQHSPECGGFRDVLEKLDIAVVSDPAEVARRVTLPVRATGN